MPKTKAGERFRDIMFNRNHDINTITIISMATKVYLCQITKAK